MSGILGKLFKTGAEKLVTSIGDAFDKNFTNKEEKAAAMLLVEKEINRHMEAISMQAKDWYELQLKDVDSARKMQIEALKQDNKFAKNFIYYLSAFIVLAATGFGFGLFFLDFPEENRRMIEMFADVYLFAAAGTVINFFYGSNKSQNPHLPEQVNKDSVVVNK